MMMADTISASGEKWGSFKLSTWKIGVSSLQKQDGDNDKYLVMAELVPPDSARTCSSHCASTLCLYEITHVSSGARGLYQLNK